MADKDFKSDGVPEITRYEHDRKNVGTKRVDLWGYQPGTDEKVRITALDNGDGTYSLSSSDAVRKVVKYYSAALTDVASITPTAGKAIQVQKVLVTNSGNNATFNNVALSSSSLGTFLQGEAISTSMGFTLAADETLDITLANSGTVYVNIQYKEL